MTWLSRVYWFKCLAILCLEQQISRRTLVLYLGREGEWHKEEMVRKCLQNCNGQPLVLFAKFLWPLFCMHCPVGAIITSAMGLFILYAMFTILQEFKNNIEKKLVVFIFQF